MRCGVVLQAGRKRLQTRQNEDGDDLHQLSQGVKTMSDNPMNSVLAVALSPVTDGLQALATLALPPQTQQFVIIIFQSKG